MNPIVRWKMFFVALGAFVAGLTLGLLLVAGRLSKRCWTESVTIPSWN